MISSTANAQVKAVIQLQKKAKEREEKRLFVIEGKKLFEEIKRDAPGHIVKTYATEAFLAEEEGAALLAGMEYEAVTPEAMRAMAETMTPQGILSLVRMPQYSLAEMTGHKDAFLLLLEELRDPGNLGTIMRTAEAAGVNGVILSRGSVDMYNPKTVRATMGAIFRVPFVYAEDFDLLLKKLSGDGIAVYAAHLDGERFYDEEAYEGKTAILVGNEANGLTGAAAAAADSLIKIPMEGKTESLNAAAAAAVLLYEVYRKRRLRGEICRTKKE